MEMQKAGPKFEKTSEKGILVNNTLAPEVPRSPYHGEVAFNNDALMIVL